MDPELRGPRDIGRDHEREFGDEPPPAYRDRAPDYLAPIDESAPVSGHARPRESTGLLVDAPEHDWAHAARLISPALRPAGTTGMRAADLDLAALAAHAATAHSQPIVEDGPCGLAIVYGLQAGGFDVIVNAEHLLSWGVGPQEVAEAAFDNLRRWSAHASWTDEVSGDRRLLSSDSGDGGDAARILLPEVREHLAAELSAAGRVLVGLPERHLLIAAALRPDDDEFAALFAEFVVEHSAGADEPIDRRVFELTGGTLVEFDAGAGDR
ncbi:MAG TPA: DUF1444 family protein [Candidatus Limnocylindrales bacterium]|nr:DUF1444 family protein [Candidatus Limnocylindrales bacterium]